MYRTKKTERFREIETNVNYCNIFHFLFFLNFTQTHHDHEKMIQCTVGAKKY